jgi:hypothetical protein
VTGRCRELEQDTFDDEQKAIRVGIPNLDISELQIVSRSLKSGLERSFGLEGGVVPPF